MLMRMIESVRNFLLAQGTPRTLKGRLVGPLAFAVALSTTAISPAKANLLVDDIENEVGHYVCPYLDDFETVLKLRKVPDVVDKVAKQKNCFFLSAKYATNHPGTKMVFKSEISDESAVQFMIVQDGNVWTYWGYHHWFARVETVRPAPRPAGIGPAKFIKTVFGCPKSALVPRMNRSEADSPTPVAMEAFDAGCERFLSGTENGRDGHVLSVITIGASGYVQVYDKHGASSGTYWVPQEAVVNLE